MTFPDTYAGLENIRYPAFVDSDGNINLWANAAGFEHHARYFLKLARSEKEGGYHNHHSLEFNANDACRETFCCALREEKSEDEEAEAEAEAEADEPEGMANSEAVFDGEPELIIGMLPVCPYAHVHAFDYGKRN